jgi:lipoic acid synthetase
MILETKPQWFKVRYNQEAVEKVTKLMDELELNTVCNEASCPNMGECYSSGTATFMILGRICTRSCRFCDVTHGRPGPVNEKEPQQLAQAVKKMGLEYVVITSVDRDDLQDYGAGHFAEVIEEVRKQNPHTMIEVLTPDFQGDQSAIDKVIAAKPDVFNHNMESVRRISPKIRHRATYDCSLDVLEYVKKQDPSILTKTGIMLGLGETADEINELMDDLRAVNVDFLTIGQYLQPSPKHYPLHEYVPVETFAEYQRTGMTKKFKYVASSPLVRSSYRARAAVESTHTK